MSDSAGGPDERDVACATACCLLAALVLRTVLGGGGKPNKAPADKEAEGKKATRNTQARPKSEPALSHPVDAPAVSDQAGSCSSLSSAETR